MCTLSNPARKGVLIGWAIGTVGCFALLWLSALSNGKDPLDSPLLLTGISILCGLGFAALTIGPLFMAYRAFASAPVFELEPGEEIVEDMLANHFLRGEGRGGRLLLTNRRVGFRPHRFNVQLDTWSARLADVRKLECEGERFLLVHVEREAEPQWIVVQSPGRIAEEIEALREDGRVENDARVAHEGRSEHV